MTRNLAFAVSWALSLVSALGLITAGGSASDLVGAQVAQPVSVPEDAGPTDELIVAYYGHPNSPYMGIVGRLSREELVRRVKATAAEYQALVPGRRVVPAIYLIYGTCQPEGKIGYLSDATTLAYIRYAEEQGVLVFLDHQIGVNTLQAAADRLLPYLRFPNVHIAFDFEWRTNRPMEEIGFVRGDELNWLQGYVRAYLAREGLGGRKYIVFHQFKASMLRESEKVITGIPQVELIHCTSGWGPPQLKTATHAYNAGITQIPTKGFKLWYYYSDKPGIHYDDPLMTPAEVLGLSPQPKLIIYQ
jgi:hypothetical protein